MRIECFLICRVAFLFANVITISNFNNKIYNWTLDSICCLWIVIVSITFPSHVIKPFNNLKHKINCYNERKIVIYCSKEISLQTVLMQICPWQHISVITKHMIYFRTRVLNETRRNIQRLFKTILYVLTRIINSGIQIDYVSIKWLLKHNNV